MIRILVVEDEQAISNLIAVNLRKAGYACDCVYDGMSAADALEEGAYTQGSDQSFSPVILEQAEFLLLPDDRVHALLEEESLVVPFSDLVGRAAIRIAPWRRLAVFVP